MREQRRGTIEGSGRGRDPLLEMAVRSFMPVESFTRDPVKRQEVEIPEVGARWGGPATFNFVDPTTEAGAEADPLDPSGVTGMRVIFDLGVEEIVRVTDITPVYYEYEILRVERKDDPEAYIDAVAATRLLIPVSSELRDFRIGYVMNGTPIFEQRQIETYAWLALPSVLEIPGYDSSHITQIGTGSAGVFPTGPEEMSYGLQYDIHGYPIDSYYRSFGTPSPSVYWS